MEKAKKEKIVLLILLPIFVLGLIVKLTGRIKQQQQLAAPAAAYTVKQKQEEDIRAEAQVLEELKLKLKKVEYEAGEFLDPLKDKLSVHIAGITPKMRDEVIQRMRPRPELPQLNITGLIWNTDRPQAIIDGNVLSAGDEIGEVRLLSVNKDGIEVEYKGFEFFVGKQAGIISGRSMEDEDEYEDYPGYQRR